METPRTRVLSFLLLIPLLCLVAFPGCKPPSEGVRTSGTSGSGEIKVVATIFPISDIAKRVGGDLIDVQTILPAGASPHTFELSPTQIRDISRADLVVCIGRGLDDWVLGNQARSILKLSGVVQLVEGDPHIWTDPILVRDFIAPAIANRLVDIKPEYGAGFESNLKAFQAELSALDETIREGLGRAANNRFISLHSAWRYFARRYGLEEVGSIVEFPGEEPSAKWLKDLIELARSKGARVVFVEPQLSSKAAEVIAREIKGKVVMLDPLGGSGVPGRDSYISLMTYNYESMKKAFEE